MPDGNRPNVILVSMDATRVDHLSCYGYTKPTTPFLGRFAEGAVLYRNAISAACWTLPSHASMFTGLFVSQHGTDFANPVLSKEVDTLPEVLRAAGYQTAGFPMNAWLDRVFGFHRGFETYRMRGPFLDRISTSSRAGKLAARAFEHLYLSKKGRASRQTLQRVRNWFGRQYSANRPFFLFVLLSDAHLPHAIHPQSRVFLGDRVRDARRVNQDPHRFIVGRTRMTDDDFELLRDRYDGELAYMDCRIGELLDIVGRHVSLEDTLVVITADHGENLGDHGFMGHQYCLYDSLIHVPMVIRFPGSAGLRGVRVDELVQTHELFATVLGVTGIARGSVRQQVQGRCLLPETISEHPLPFAVSEELNPNLRRIRRLFPGLDCSRLERRLRSIRTSSHKYIWASDGAHELYDLGKDPGELHNLVETRADVANELRGRLERWSGSIDPRGHGVEHVDFDALVAGRLKALGYL